MQTGLMRTWIPFTNCFNKKRKAHDTYLANPHSSTLARKWKDLRAEAQRQIRLLENCWWIEKAQEIQAFADKNDMKGFYNVINSIYGSRKNSISPISSRDGSTILKERTEILDRWAEHFSALLNHRNPVEESIIDTLPDLPPIQEMDRIPEIKEVLDAIKTLKEGKSCGPDGLPGELFKYGGYLLKKQLHKIICALWRGEVIPKSWIDSSIIPIYKNKGERTD